MKIYLAAPFEELVRLRGIRSRIHETTKCTVVSSWLDEEPTSTAVVPVEGWPLLASRDLQEIRACKVLILDTFATNTRGGSQVEFGFALGFQTQVWLVGPIRNVFHTLAQQKFTNWDRVIEELGKYA